MLLKASQPTLSPTTIFPKFGGWLWKYKMATKDSPPRATVDLISTGTTISKEIPSETLEFITRFYNSTGFFDKIKPEHNVKDSFSNLVGGVLKVISIQRGKISCLLTIKPPILKNMKFSYVHEIVLRWGEHICCITSDVSSFDCSSAPAIVKCETGNNPASQKNGYGGMHGGAVGAVAERVAIACARTVVGKDKSLFLGELSISYLSAAPRNAEVIVDGSVVRSGRNLTVVAVEFRHKEPGRLAFMTRATFYSMPIASL